MDAICGELTAVQYLGFTFLEIGGHLYFLPTEAQLARRIARARRHNLTQRYSLRRGAKRATIIGVLQSLAGTEREFKKRSLRTRIGIVSAQVERSFTASHSDTGILLRPRRSLVEACVSEMWARHHRHPKAFGAAVAERIYAAVSF